jgi:acetyl esterase/lipase
MVTRDKLAERRSLPGAPRFATGRVIASGVVLVLSLLLSSLLILPAPGNALAMLAVALGEKSFIPVALSSLALLALWRATAAAPPAARRWQRPLALILLTATVVLCAWPPIAAYRLAGQRGVKLRLGRYLSAAIDTGAARPDGTVVFARVEGRPLHLDFYRPAPGGPPGDPVPAVIVVHGGGWSQGDKGETALWSGWLARQGFAVFDIQYRLAPPPSWRSATGDVKCAIGWVKETAARSATGIGVDPERVAVLGRSAGGHLALLAAYTATEDDLPPSCPVRDPRASAVVALYAPTDLVWGYGRPANRLVYDTSQKLRDFLGGTPDSAPAAYQQAAIVNRVTARSPRTLLVHGARDQFVSPLHVDRLRPHLESAEVEHDTLIIPYGQHGFDYIFGGLSGQILESTLLRFLQQGVTMMAGRRPHPAQTPLALPRSAPVPASRVGQNVHQLAEGIAYEKTAHAPGLIDRSVLDRDLGLLHASKRCVQIVDLD